MQTDEDLTECLLAAQAYRERLLRVLELAGVPGRDGMSPGELEQEVEIWDHHRSHQMGYGRTVIVRCELAGVDLLGTHVSVGARSYDVEVPPGIRTEPITYSLLAILPGGPPTSEPHGGGPATST